MSESMSRESFCMAGCQFDCGERYDARPVDFFIPGDNRVFVAWGDWWTAPSLQPDEGYSFFSGKLTEQGGAWVVANDRGDRGVFSPAADEDSADVIQRVRDRVVLHRGAYVAALESLRQQSPPDIDLTPWLDAVTRMPQVDSADYAMRRVAGMREIVRMYLVDSNRVRVDVIVADAKAAVTANGNAWLTQVADAYTASENRATPRQFLEWLATQRPYGAYELSGADVINADGMLDTIAQKQSAQA